MNPAAPAAHTWPDAPGARQADPRERPLFGSSRLPVSEHPRYHQLRLVLRQRIQDGIYSPAFSMPGERELAREFGVGRVTVRTALGQLEKEGLIVRLRGRGTLTVPPPPDDSASALRGGLRDDLVAISRSTELRVLVHRWVAASGRIARALALDPGAPLLEVHRVRLRRGRGISFTTSHVPAEFAHEMSPAALTERSMTTLLHEAGATIAAVEQTMGAAVANGEVAGALDLPEGTPLLQVRRVALDASDRPVLHLVGLYHPERYEYQMRLAGVGGETRVWVDCDQPG